MNRNWVAAIPALASCASIAQAQTPVIPQVYPFGALGYQQIVAPSSATTLTIPAGARIAEICVENNGIRYLDTGTAPTATTGMPAGAGVCFQYSGPLGALQLIQQTSSATVDIAYYR